MSISPRQRICVAVIGVGLVGSEFVSQLTSFNAPSLFSLISLSSSKKTLFYPEVTCQNWKSSLDSSGESFDTLSLTRKLASLVLSGQKVVIVDNTSSDVIASLYPQWLKSSINIITPNKKAFSGELALYNAIMSACAETGARCLNEATVGAGLPIISTLKDLIATGDQILKIEGVFSGTMSYIFNEFSTGKPGGPSFSSVVKAARENGYTEPHPADDLAGSDVARKLTILSRLVPSLHSYLPSGYASVATTSLVPPALAGASNGDEFITRLPEFDTHFDEMKEQAAKEGAVLRYVGIIDVLKGEVRAGLERYPTTHPFATSLGGSDNIIMFHTARYGTRPMIIQGAGAGAAVTAMGVMSDLLKLV